MIKKQRCLKNTCDEKNISSWKSKVSFKINFILVVTIKMALKKLKLPKLRLPKLRLSKKSLKLNKKEKMSKPFIDDVKSIFRCYRGQMIWISVLSGFLLFLLNILI